MSKVSLFRLSVDRAPLQDGRTPGVNSAGIAPTQGRRSGAPDSLRAGLADPPDDWPTASSCDAAAVTVREPKCS